VGRAHDVDRHRSLAAILCRVCEIQQDC
jgi:hypothetical protein